MDTRYETKRSSVSDQPQPSPRGPILTIRMSDQRNTFIYWRRDDGPADFEQLAEAEVVALLAELDSALLVPRLKESSRDLVRRVLTREAFSAPERELALAQKLASVLLPSRLAAAIMSAAESGRPVVKVIPSPSTAAVPWETLALPDSRRLIDLADIAYDVPATVKAKRARLPQPWADAQRGPVLYVLDPALPPNAGLGQVIAPRGQGGWQALEAILQARQDSGRLRPADRAIALKTSVTRADLDERLRAEPYSRLLYLGHATAGEGTGQAALYLSDMIAATDNQQQATVTRHGPLTALELFAGTNAVPAVTAVPGAISESFIGVRPWPMPNRVAIIACASGSDFQNLEPLGLVVAIMNSGAELVTATKWTIPSDAAFEIVSRPATSMASTSMALAVDKCHEAPDAVSALAGWQRSQLERWTAHGNIEHSPLLWAALSTYAAPAMPDLKLSITPLQEHTVFEINVAPSTLRPVVLRETSVVMGRADHLDTLEGRVSLGMPISFRLDDPALQEEHKRLHAYSEQASDLLFYYLQVDVGFSNVDSDPFIDAVVEVSLSDPRGGYVVARSLSPDRLQSASPLTQSTAITSDLKFARIERRSELQQSVTTLIAVGEGTPRATWTIKRVGDARIEGTYSLRLIAECQSQTARAVISVSSAIRRRRIGILTYQAQLPSELMIHPLAPA
jgi:hypothetical protein